MWFLPAVRGAVALPGKGGRRSVTVFTEEGGACQM